MIVQILKRYFVIEFLYQDWMTILHYKLPFFIFYHLNSISFFVWFFCGLRLFLFLYLLLSLCYHLSNVTSFGHIFIFPYGSVKSFTYLSCFICLCCNFCYLLPFVIFLGVITSRSISLMQHFRRRIVLQLCIFCNAKFW